MKKVVSVLLICLLLTMVPLRGYASTAPVVFGIGEEVILPFIMALLGVQAVSNVDSYEDLVSYNTNIYDSLIESLGGLAYSETVKDWVMMAIQGLIQTDSVVWQKLKELALGQYTASSGVNYVPEYSDLSFPEFQYYDSDSAIIYVNGNIVASVYGVEKVFAYRGDANAYGNIPYQLIGASSTNTSLPYSYEYNDKTVYYSSITSSGSSITTSPECIHNASLRNEINSINFSTQKAAWLMIYEGVSVSENIASYSDAFSNVLTSEDKESLVNGSNVIQLYNPSALQNGLEIIPGGDPEEDPNLKKIPFAITADWWNFLQQFGSGDNSNQYVNAYNALNGIHGGTVGRISDAYDSLGIASVAATAANALEGILDLTKKNIYPNQLTVEDTINDAIPIILDPEVPDENITNESPQGLYKLPDLRDYFPFCIPFDLIDFFSCFVAEPETPQFVIAASTGFTTVQQEVDLEFWDGIASMVRTFELAIFVLGLILITRNLIRG